MTPLPQPKVTVPLNDLLVIATARPDGAIDVSVCWHPCSLLAMLHTDVLRLRSMERAQQRAATSAQAGPASLALHRVMLQTLTEAMAVLVRARRLADATFLSERADANIAKGARQLRAYVLELGSTVEDWLEEQLETGALASRGEIECADRSVMLRDEARALADAAHNARSESDAVRLKLLREMIEWLRALEARRAFQAELLRAQMSVSRAVDARYSRDNFAYGSTPFGTWLALAASEPVATAIRQCASRGEGGGEAQSREESDGAPPGHAFVAGSSIGWFVFYLALHSAVPVVGYELLRPLHDAAVSTRDGLVARAAALGVTMPRMELCCEDALGADLSAARLVILMSQCWDEQLRAQMHAKLCSECPRGAIVIDYSPPMARPTGLADALEPVCRVPGRVSWELDFSFSVLRVPSTRSAEP